MSGTGSGSSRPDRVGWILHDDAKQAPILRTPYAKILLVRGRRAPSLANGGAADGEREEALPIA